jgi:predicted DNA-binding transcriptional regulator AlpA
VNTPEPTALCPAVDRKTVYTVCRGCGKDLNGKRPQARFCSDQCRSDFHNEQRRRAKENPPSTATYQATITIPYRGQILVLDRATFDAAARRGRELAAAYTEVDTGALLTVWGVIARIGHCRAWIYNAINRGEFPSPTVLSAPGRKRKVAWRAADVADWLRRRCEKTKARTAEGRPGQKKKQQTTEGQRHHGTDPL